MTTLHIFTEETSAKNVFEVLLPKILPESIFFRIYPHQGKQDLEHALKTSLPSISRIPGAKILITRDQDSSDCKEVKAEILELVGENCRCDFLIRIVCKELESWFLGDLEAVKYAYPRFKPEQYVNDALFRNVDKIANPDQTLLRIIPELKNHETLPKLAVSEAIAPYLNITSNVSRSFNQTLLAINTLVS